MIRGTTTIVAHFGDPIAPVKAPMIYNPWFEKRGVDAVVVPMGVTSADYAAVLPGVFRIIGHDDDGGAHAGAYVARTLDVQRVAVIDDDSAFGRALAATFIRSLHDNGMAVVAQESVNAKTSDFSQLLGRIRTKNPGLVFFAGLGIFIWKDSNKRKSR